MEGIKDSKVLSPTLADIYLQQGHIEKAIEIYEKLLKKEPGNEFLKKRVIALKKELKEMGKKTGLKKLLTKKLW